MANCLSLGILFLLLPFSLSSASHTPKTPKKPKTPPSSHKKHPPPCPHKYPPPPNGNHPPPPSPGNHPPPSQYSPNISEACKASSDFSNCVSWLSQYGQVPPSATILEVIQAALRATTANLKKGAGMVKQIEKQSNGNLNKSTAAETCLELVGHAEYRVSQVELALVVENMKDARAWMSAALVNTYDIWSALKYVNDTDTVLKTMVFFNGTAILGTSSALAMMVNYDIYGEDTNQWALPKSERDGFWENVTGDCKTIGGRVPADLTADVNVCKGGCRYSTVQAAVDAAPSNTAEGQLFVIKIGEGVYDETVRVSLEKKNVVFLGEGMGKTVITGSRNVGQPGVNTYNSATVAVMGDRFMASNLTITNTAGPNAHQAVALRLDSDRSIIDTCELIGHQDTLYSHSLRHFFVNCTIQGNVDFIFGNSAAVFDHCTILVNPRQVSNNGYIENDAVTAQGRTDLGQSTGFVFLHSLVNGTADYMAQWSQNKSAHNVFLGRPWKMYSRTVFIECELGALVSGPGWMPWDKTGFALNTLYYGEYHNCGKGSKITQRVSWSSQIPANHVSYYCPSNFIQAPF